jgi:tRNA pseudouridine38-40 synthase
MPRYFIEVSYKGTNYSGFQKQHNSNSIQAEVEKAFEILYRQKFELTGSSRTDAGVHALQNYFHFDTEVIPKEDVYNLNAILPADIVAKRVFRVAADAHCRFDAVAREYKYHIYNYKDPFLAGRAFYIPYPVDIGLMNEAAAAIISYTDFTSFSKRNTQVNNFNCTILASEWSRESGCLVYTVKANRFLRGMVKGLVGTMLLVGKRKISLADFRAIIEARDCSSADFSVPSEGLFLNKVVFP